MFNGEVCRGREELVEQWWLYFKDLYVPSESPVFDSEWKQVVESTVNETFGLLTADENAFVPSEIIQKVIKTLPRGKAENDDHGVYECFIYGMQEVAPLLANLYTYVLRCGYIPESMKRGVIITLHKGGKKRKDEPNNYRAITLSSVVPKLWDGVIRSLSRYILREDQHPTRRFSTWTWLYYELVYASWMHLLWVWTVI